jgi:hypothetical protein
LPVGLNAAMISRKASFIFAATAIVGACAKAQLENRRRPKK